MVEDRQLTLRISESGVILIRVDPIKTASAAGDNEVPRGLDTMNLQSLARARRAAIAIGLTVASVFALAGCGSDDADGKVQLTIAIQSQDGGSDYYTKLVDAVQKLHPDVKLKTVEYPSDQLGTVLTTQLQAGNAPDIIYGSPGTGNTNSLGLYAGKGYLVDLADKPWATSSIPDSSKSLFYSGNKLFAIPLDTVVVPLTVNKTALGKAGLAIPDTYDEFLASCGAARSAKTAMLNVAGAFPANAGFVGLEIAASRVYAQNPAWNDDRAAGKTTFAGTPGWIRTFQVIRQMYENDCMQSGAEGAGGPQIFQSVASGRTLGMFGPSAVAASLQTADSKNTYQFTAFPPDTAGQEYVFASPSDAFAVNAGSKHKEQAISVLQDFSTVDIRNQFANWAGNVSLETTLHGAQVPAAFSEISALLTNPAKSGPLPSFSWPNGNVYQKLGEGVQGLMTGQVSPEELAKQLDSAWDGR
ncbi:extracellular solute-binding protein [Amycolatopsis acidicola]|uniref:Extracellular solute-binding protein n=1 Tax=Amycolatopsis acidicola TaxID=2596893 RepID=A0A5N0V2S7_9PSEU|nr:extracellular solute-binding protein [Amycolatopsis acidicola]KAA9160739.1 extracellular solute-binding protein [Amycolatopsis acidicola]